MAGASGKSVRTDLLTGEGQDARSRKDGGALYERVASTLRDEIESGVHSVGALLPTEAELCERFSVSRHTVREALRKLRTDKLVSSRQGAGTIVEPLRHSDEFVLSAGSINELVSYSANAWLDPESIGIESIEGELAERAGIEPGEQWLAARGYVVSSKSELPVCWGEHFIARQFDQAAERLPHHRGPVFRLIEDVSGVEIVEIAEEISGCLLPEDLAAGLGAEPASAAIEVKRVYYAADGTVAQITLHIHPASRFRYATRMRRPRG